MKSETTAVAATNGSQKAIPLISDQAPKTAFSEIRLSRAIHIGPVVTAALVMGSQGVGGLKIISLELAVIGGHPIGVRAVLETIDGQTKTRAIPWSTIDSIVEA